MFYAAMKLHKQLDIAAEYSAYIDGDELKFKHLDTPIDSFGVSRGDSPQSRAIGLFAFKIMNFALQADEVPHNVGAVLDDLFGGFLKESPQSLQTTINSFITAVSKKLQKDGVDPKLYKKRVSESVQGFAQNRQKAIVAIAKAIATKNGTIKGGTGKLPAKKLVLFTSIKESLWPSSAAPSARIFDSDDEAEENKDDSEESEEQPSAPRRKRRPPTEPASDGQPKAKRARKVVNFSDDEDEVPLGTMGSASYAEEEVKERVGVAISSSAERSVDPPASPIYHPDMSDDDKEEAEPAPAPSSATLSAEQAEPVASSSSLSVDIERIQSDMMVAAGQFSATYFAAELSARQTKKQLTSLDGLLSELTSEVKKLAGRADSRRNAIAGERVKSLEKENALLTSKLKSMEADKGRMLATIKRLTATLNANTKRKRRT